MKNEGAYWCLINNFPVLLSNIYSYVKTKRYNQAVVLRKSISNAVTQTQKGS